MHSKFLKAFTLVEMLVALAVSSIIVAAAYSSFEMVSSQYKKNMDVIDMHTSGRAVMRIIERDIRMAGFEYRDTDAKIIYGTISNPLAIIDSGNKCCDEVTVIYDYYDEDTQKAERLRIRYWAEAYSTNKGARHRLFKQKDILGQNKKILAKPILGKKDVMADYIEDLQLSNTSSTKSSSLVDINLTLRTKNQYSKDRQFKKKEYHGGNFKLDKTDKYKRDTFSSTVLVRNLAL